MSLICVLRGHDWEEVGSVEEEFVINNLLQNTFRKYATRDMEKRKIHLRGVMPPDHSYRILTQKICLRCCEVEDNIKNYLAECRTNAYKEMEEKRRLERRQERAEAMLEHCAKNKLKKIYNKEERCKCYILKKKQG